MSYIDFIFINMNVNYTYIAFFLVIFTILILILSIELVSENVFIVKKIFFIPIIVIYFSLVSIALFLYYYTIKVEDIERFIRKGYLNSESSEILINKMSVESWSDYGSKNFKEITYSMVSLSIAEDRKNKKQQEISFESEKIIKLLDDKLINKNN